MNTAISIYTAARICNQYSIPLREMMEDFHWANKHDGVDGKSAFDRFLGAVLDTRLSNI